MPEDRSSWQSLNPLTIGRWVVRPGWRPVLLMSLVMLPVSCAIVAFHGTFHSLQGHPLAGMLFRFILCGTALFLSFYLVRALGLLFPHTMRHRDQRLVHNEDC
jgi:hypothetical protein